MARSLVEHATGPVGRAVQSALFSDAARLPEPAGARRRIFADRLRRAEPLVVRAVERGELPPGTSPAEVLRTLAGPIYFRLPVTAEPVDASTADQAARVALAAARAGVLTG